jgi:hypothetical protein
MAEKPYRRPQVKMKICPSDALKSLIDKKPGEYIVGFFIIAKIGLPIQDWEAHKPLVCQTIGTCF